MEAISAAAIEVEDLDDSGLLDAASEAERLDRQVQCHKLQIAYQWCIQHPATNESGTATWGDAGLPGLGDCDASLAGEGTPGVAPFVAEELGAAMGVSTQSAMSLMADALDLRHRFPLLSPPGSTGSGCRPSSAWWRWPRPSSRRRSRQTKEQQSRSQRYVTLTHPRPGEFAGTSYLEAAGDTQDLTAFYALVCEEAKRLGRLGDTGDYETRKAKALGVIAAQAGRARPHRPGTDGRRVTRRPVQDEPLRARLGGRPRHPLGGHQQPSVRSRSSAPPPST